MDQIWPTTCFCMDCVRTLLIDLMLKKKSEKYYFMTHENPDMGISTRIYKVLLERSGHLFHAAGAPFQLRWRTEQVGHELVA